MLSRIAFVALLATFITSTLQAPTPQVTPGAVGVAPPYEPPPAPVQAGLPLLGVIPSQGISCVAGNENKIWTLAEITDAINGYPDVANAADANYAYAAVAPPNTRPGSTLFPNPNIPPIWAAGCKPAQLYYEQIGYSYQEGSGDSQTTVGTFDAVIYSVNMPRGNDTVGSVNYCGVVTNQDEGFPGRVQGLGYHQCNAA